MFRLYAVLAFASILLAALALISCLSVEDGSRIRALPRFLWVLIILVAPLIGSIAWFLAGRPLPEGGARSRWPIGGGFPEPPSASPGPPPRSKAPDDDPDFLRSLDEPTISREDEELLRRWEEDLRRREEEQRRRDTDTEG